MQIIFGLNVNFKYFYKKCFSCIKQSCEDFCELLAYGKNL